MLRDDDESLECLENVLVVGRINPETLEVLDDKAHVINKLVATFPDLEENRDSMVRRFITMPDPSSFRFFFIMVVENESKERRQTREMSMLTVCSHV
jgi:hypothetical protein